MYFRVFGTSSGKRLFVDFESRFTASESHVSRSAKGQFGQNTGWTLFGLPDVVNLDLLSREVLKTGNSTSAVAKISNYAFHNGSYAASEKHTFQAGVVFLL